MLLKLKKPNSGPKPETECFYYKGTGHLRWNCPKYLADKKDGKVKGIFDIHYCRILLTRHYDQRPFAKTVCDAIIANGGAKNVKKVQNVCDGGAIKHGLDFSCVCDAGHTVNPFKLSAMR